MEYKNLGNTGVKISRIGFGNWLNSDDEKWTERTITHMKKAWSLGINFFDTAEAYGNGSAEKQFAAGFKALFADGVKRTEIVVSTKLFWEGLFSKNKNGLGLSRKHITEGINNSLKRLELDYVDLVFCHRFDEETPLEETCRTMDQLVRDGKVLYWGTSEWTASQIFEAFMVCERFNLVKPQMDQCQYNMMVRDKVEFDFRRLLDKYNYGTTVWSPMLGGVLTGKYNDGIPADCRAVTFEDNPLLKVRFAKMFGEANKENYLKTLRGLGEIAKEIGCTQSQLAMAWVLYFNKISAAITGCSRPEQLEDTVQAVGVVKKLTPEILERIEVLLGTKPVQDIDNKTYRPIASLR